MSQFLLKLRILLLRNSLYYFILVIITVFSLVITNVKEYKSLYNENETKFKLKIIAYKIDGNKLYLELKGKEKLVANYYFELESDKNSFASIYSLGDEINVLGEIKKPKNNTIPNTFNYKEYLKGKKVYYTLNIKSFELDKKNENLFYKLKDYVYKRVNKIDNNEYVYALVLGESLYINSESFRINGVSHLFALSGLHVSIMSAILLSVYKVIKKIFKRDTTEEKLLPYIIIFLFLMVFSFITGFKPSFIRAILFFILIGINKVYYFNIKNDNLLIVVYFIMALINPFYIYDVSFQLSWVISYFLLFAAHSQNSKNYIIKLLWTSLISLFSSLPIVINNFYQINLLSIFNNLIFVPFVSIIIYPLSLLTFVFPFLNKILSFLTNILESISKYLANVDILNITYPRISIYLIIIYYFLFIIIIKSKKKMKFIVMLIILLIYGYFKVNFSKYTEVYFLDVGQGDSCLIKTKNNKTILIDTGGYLKYEMEYWKKRRKEFDLMNSSIIPFFKSIGIKQIDYLFITHTDEDHSGYSISLVNNFKVNNIIINKGELSDIESFLNYKHIEEKYVIDNINIFSLNDLIYNNENDNSIILLLEIDNKKMLFMADASKKQEKYIINKYNLDNIFVLKVGHHGSKTSTSKELLEDISAKYSIISVGENNKFNHPNEEVIKLLSDYNSIIYRTDLYGTINYKFYKNSYKIRTYNP